MNRTLAVIRMHSLNRFGWFFLPWIIMFSSFVINLGIAVLGQPEGGVTTGGLASAYIYFFVMGIVIPADTFSFSLGLGVRRKDYFWGTNAMFGLVAVGSAILLTLFSIVENATSGWGVDLHFFHLPFLSDGTVLNWLWVHFVGIVFCYASGLVIASIYRRLGRNSLYVFFFAMIVIGSLGSYLMTTYGLWRDLFDFFSGYTASGFAGWLMLVSLVYVGVSYGLFRRATVQ
ncbi:hypothetical protein [Paenibacillus koleovorans]|uniref:hypothetical protein n=1 Tax=Paenibacillus koleovorans TaxID=121608 RepID=UPI000FDCA9E7|nr:hypothetical protein [Paenibacillus koleovorans]